MYCDFDQLPDDARVWIFQSKRAMTKEEKETLLYEIKVFLSQWQAHGKDLLASVEIRRDFFIVVGLDEKASGATGCSIDKLSHLIQNMDQKMNLSLMDPSNIAFVNKDGGIETLPMGVFRSMLHQGDFDEHTVVFNNLVKTKGELRDKHQTVIAESWHAHWLPVA